MAQEARKKNPGEKSIRIRAIRRSLLPPRRRRRKRLHKRYKNIRDTLGKTEPDEVVEMYLTALCMTFDPIRATCPPRSLKDFQIQMA